MDFSETIEIKAVDKNEQFSIDSYFFAYFHDLPAALEQIRDAVRAYRSVPGSSSPPPVIDTTVLRTPTAPYQPMQSPSVSPSSAQIPKSSSSSSFRFTSLLRPLQESLPLMRTYSAPDPPENDEYTHISRKSPSSFIPVTTSPLRMRSPSPSGPRSSSMTPTPSNMGHDHTYPPSTSSSFRSELTASPTRDGTWTVGMPSWLKMPSRKLLSSPFTSRPSVEHSASAPPTTNPGVSEVLSSHHLSMSTSRVSGEFGFFSILEMPESTVDEETTEKFRTSFAFDEKEKLLGCMSIVSGFLIDAHVFFSGFQGYIFRLLPVYGRLYISNNYFSFRSSGPLTSRTTVSPWCQLVVGISSSRVLDDPSYTRCSLYATR